MSNTEEILSKLLFLEGREIDLELCYHTNTFETSNCVIANNGFEK